MFSRRNINGFRRRERAGCSDEESVKCFGSLEIRQFCRNYIIVQSRLDFRQFPSLIKILLSDFH